MTEGKRDSKAKIQKQISVVLSNGQIMEHALDFDNEEEYVNWVKESGALMMLGVQGTVNLNYPYAIYKLQEIVGIAFKEPSKGKEPLGFQKRD